MSHLFKVGDTVLHHGTWGTEEPTEAKIIRLELTSSPNDKYGHETKQVSERDNFIATLDNSHWAYGHQISPLPELSTPCICSCGNEHERTD